MQPVESKQGSVLLDGTTGDQAIDVTVTEAGLAQYGPAICPGSGGGFYLAGCGA